MEELDQCYQKMEVLGEGTYGKVYKVIYHEDNQIYALKKIKIDKSDGFPATALREISNLIALDHPNIVKIYKVFYEPEKQKLEILYEYIEQDLKDYIINNKQEIKLNEIQNILYQTLNGIDYCHKNRIFHRDLKPGNILITKDLKVKIADFGLSRTVTLPTSTFSLEVETLWYRAPEILLGNNKYSFPVDAWSIGCIMAELCLQEPFLMGNSEIEQIFKIFQLLGTPDESNWQGISNQEQYPFLLKKIPRFKKNNRIQSLESKIGQQGVDLLSKLLEINPLIRINPKQALKHPFFKNFN